MSTTPLLSRFAWYSIAFFSVVPIQVYSQVWGCTDPLSLNYDPLATINDGSCIYAATTTNAQNSFPLGTEIQETSGLIWWNGKLYTHNDNGDTNLYAISPTDGSILETLPLPGTSNVDWEAIAQDENYLYIGDFGNNTQGNRTDLKIYRISKTEILLGTVQPEIINFIYEDQFDFTPQPPNSTDFDCEAFIVSSQKIYLFTKQWQSQQTAIYSLSKTPGERIAHLENTLNTQGLITDATFMEEERLVVLSGYSTLLQPFLYLLYDYQPQDFISGNKRKLDLDLPFHQVEGITTENGKNYYLTNELFTYNQMLTIPQKLHHVDLSDYLSGYLDQLNTPRARQTKKNIEIYPNPTSNSIKVGSPFPLNNQCYYIYNSLGQKVLEGKLPADQTIDVSALAANIYFLRLECFQGGLLRVVRR